VSSACHKTACTDIGSRPEPKVLTSDINNSPEKSIIIFVSNHKKANIICLISADGLDESSPNKSKHTVAVSNGRCQ